MKKLMFLLVFCALGFSSVWAQKTISGRVTSAEDGLGLPGVNVVVKSDPSIGAATDIDGKWTLIVPNDNVILVFTAIGMKPIEIIATKSSNIVMKQNSQVLDEVVVTALGISREKKSLGYAVTKIGGDAVNEAKETNITNSLSGKVAGVQIRQANTMGGSANILIRGSASLTGNNQALFVVDGVPIDNSNTNSNNQSAGWGGYDYGNAASDINPEDVESVSVLRGAAATALYGSRAANGVVLITTKKGNKRKGIGVTINSGITFSKINKATMPDYQYEYGAGYSPKWSFKKDVDGDGVVEIFVNTNDDASWGPKFDPKLNVVHWDAIDPNSPNYLEKRPWVAPNSKVYDFFETGIKYINGITLEGGEENFNFRLSYTNSDESGILPNSSIKKNTVSFRAKYNLNEKLSAEFSGSYINTKGKGRYGTGYDDQNPMQNFAQWFQTNIDFARMKNYWESSDGSMRTWNAKNPILASTNPVGLSAAYANNPYWTRYMNFEDDKRDRLFGFTMLSYKFNDIFTLNWRTSLDFYHEEQNERIAVGSHAQASFTNFRRTFKELNSDIMLNFNKQISDFNLNGLIGLSYRENSVSSISAFTQGGLVVPKLYTTSNSKVATSPIERLFEKNLNSAYANVSVGYKNFAFIEGSIRVDESSTLPEDENRYVYPAVSTSLILSQLNWVKDLSFLSFAKLRANYAEVGNDTDPYRLISTYTKGTNWAKEAPFSVDNRLNNPNLKPERTKSYELGLEAKLFNSRLGFDIAYYKSNSFDQIMPVNVSLASGHSQVFVNAGEIENKGVELSFNTVPLKTDNFQWNLDANWSKNNNEVISLYKDVKNILITSAWDISVNASIGEPYGVMKGTDFVYTNGKKTVDSRGFYKKTKETDKVIGNIQPDWNAGIINTFAYKGITLRALIDIQKGGDIFSADRKYGLATGLYAETAGLNSRGKPKRDPVSEGGGILHAEAVNEDGTPNTTYASAGAWGGDQYYERTPTARYIYDASYVKLREISLSYTLPKSLIEKTFLRKVVVSAIGRNLAIIHKNTPGFDPETGQSSGNRQGIANASYPTTRTFGFNITLGF